MKKIVLASLMMVCLPYLAMAQSVDDDLYFIPKKKAEKKEEVKQEVKVWDKYGKKYESFGGWYISGEISRKTKGDF